MQLIRPFKNIGLCSLICLFVVMSQAAKARVLSAEGEGETIQAATHAAFKALAEQVQVEVKSKSASSVSIQGDQFTDSFTDNSSVSAQAQFENIDKAVSKQPSGYKVNLTVDLAKNYQQLVKQQLYLQSQLDLGFSQLNTLVKSQLLALYQQADTYQKNLAKLNRLTSYFQPTDALPTNYLLNSSAELNRLQQKVDAVTQIHAKVASANVADATEQALVLIAQQLKVEVKAQTKSQTTVAGNQVENTFEETASTKSAVKLLGVELNTSSLANNEYLVEASLFPLRSYTLYQQEYTHLLKQLDNSTAEKDNFIKLFASDSVLSQLAEMSETARLLAGILEQPTQWLEQTQFIVEAHSNKIQQAKNHWQQHKFAQLPQIAQYISGYFAFTQQPQVCDLYQTLPMEMLGIDTIASQLVKVATTQADNQPQAELAWYLYQDNQQNYKLRVIQNQLEVGSTAKQLDVLLAPELLTKDDKIDHSYILLELALADNSKQPIDLELFKSDLADWVEQQTEREVVEVTSCMQSNWVGQQQLANAYQASDLIKVTILPELDVMQLANSNIEHKYALSKLNWTITDLTSNKKENKFTTIGKSLGTDNDQLAIQQAFQQGLDKAKRKLRKLKG